MECLLLIYTEKLQMPIDIYLSTVFIRDMCSKDAFFFVSRLVKLQNQFFSDNLGNSWSLSIKLFWGMRYAIRTSGFFFQADWATTGWFMGIFRFLYPERPLVIISEFDFKKMNFKGVWYQLLILEPKISKFWVISRWLKFVFQVDNFHSTDLFCHTIFPKFEPKV